MAEKVKNFEMIELTKGKLPRLPFASIKDAILGKQYELSVASVSPNESRKLNRMHRAKDTPTNILSFPLERNSGEIVLELNKIKKDAPDFGMKYTKFLKFLFIHGCLHLKGFEHSSTMEKEEQKLLKKFS